MSLSARRLTQETGASRPRWQPPEMTSRAPRHPVSHPILLAGFGGGDADHLSPTPLADRLLAAEREAFAKGFAAGEQARDAEATARVDDAMARVVATIGELTALRPTVMRQAEHDLVRLAIAMAERIVRREITVDPDLLVSIARTAIARLGDNVAATIHLHPHDYELVAASREQMHASGAIQIVADPEIEPGGCLVRSAAGLIDTSINTQIRELTRAMFGDPAAEEPSGDNDVAGA